MLKLSTKGRYATRIAVYLALHGNEEPVRKHDIAKAEGISADYVEQILVKLKTAGLVRSYRGMRGGFTLAKDAADISVKSVLEATEGTIMLVDCTGEQCSRVTRCIMNNLWQEAADAVQVIFIKHTIATLAQQVHDLERELAPDYSI